MHVLTTFVNALGMAFAMFWEILWALILGFFLSAVVQAIVSKAEMSRLRPDDSAKTLSVAAALGAASSSCSYAAVAFARSIFRKEANFAASMVFELASTNLVVELGIIMNRPDGLGVRGGRVSGRSRIGGNLGAVILGIPDQTHGQRGKAPG